MEITLEMAESIKQIGDFWYLGEIKKKKKKFYSYFALSTKLPASKN